MSGGMLLRGDGGPTLEASVNAANARARAVGSSPTQSAGPPDATSPQSVLNESAWIREMVEEKRKRSDNAVERMKQVSNRPARWAGLLWRVIHAPYPRQRSLTRELVASVLKKCNWRAKTFRPGSRASVAS